MPDPQAPETSQNSCSLIGVPALHDNGLQEKPLDNTSKSWVYDENRSTPLNENKNDFDNDT